MIFYGVVCATGEVMRDFGPSVPQHFVGEEKEPFLLRGPLIFPDVGIEMVMPSFSTLFADSTYVEL